MKREVRNYIYLGSGFLLILMFIMWDLLFTINEILIRYNELVRNVNRNYDLALYEKEVYFFGVGIMNLSLLMDLILLFAFSTIITMVILKIYWIIKYQRSE